MTAPSSKHLASVLKRAGFERLAERAERDEYHDYLSDHAAPSLELDMALLAIIQDPTYSSEKRDMASQIRARHHDGAFDATKAESEAWVASPDGQRVTGQLNADLKKKT